MAELNVAGIEIENSSNADVHRNVANRNAGGILVFELPDLPVKGGGSIRVFDNRITDHDTRNFVPPGNIVASVPSGTGIMMMAASSVHVFRNQLKRNRTAHILVAAYFLPVKDPNYDPLSRDIVLRDNAYGPGGGDPQGMLQPLGKALGGQLPPIVWDGVDTAAGKTVPATLHVLEPAVEPFISLALRTSPVDLGTARPTPQRPVAAAAPPAEPAAVTLPQDRV